MFYILRRKNLGKGSCTKIQQQVSNEIQIIRSDLPKVIEPNSTILRWGCRTPLPNLINPKFLNKAENISHVNNKLEFRKYLQEQYPYLVPKTWYSYLDPSITYPCILRPHKHAQGKHLYFCKDLLDLIKAITNLSNSINTYYISYYISEYIPKIEEYRICFIQGLVAWVARKIPANSQAIAWNVNQGGKFENIRWKDWPIDVIENAYLAYKESGLYLSGIDIMIDKDGRSFILEANSAPSHTSPYRIQETARCINWGINNHFETLQPNTQYKKYLKWIHPALIENQQNEPTNP